MALLEQIQADTRAALKAGEKERVGALRLVAAAIQQVAKDGGGEVDEVAVLQRERKRRLEAVSTYRDAGREDLAAGEQAEAELIASYLPEQLSDEELEGLVAAAVTESGAGSPKEMGKVMSVLMPKVAGRADGKRVSAAVKEKLTG